MNALRRLALTAALMGSSCRAPTVCAAAIPPVLLGSWSYTATQTSPTTASVSGVLRITSQCARQIGGTLDVTQTDAQGNTQRLTGAVSGMLVDTTLLDFDAFLGATPRRHDGAVRSDSMRGTWFEVTGASGSFTSVWTAP